MAVIKWDPQGNIVTLQNRINQLFRDSFPCQTDESGQDPRCAWTPRVDIYETEGEIFITADLPGVKKQDVMVEIKDDTLTIRGHRSMAPAIADDQYVRRERSFGNFHRAFALHAIVTPESIRAKFKDGVLVVEIPKPEKEKPRHIPVDIE